MKDRCPTASCPGRLEPDGPTLKRGAFEGCAPTRCSVCGARWFTGTRQLYEKVAKEDPDAD